MVFRNIVVDNLVSMTSNFAEKIDYFICNFSAVDFNFFSVFDQILEEVSILLTKHVTLLVNLKEV